MKTIKFGDLNLVDFTPEDNQPKGIVHISTIQRLANLLPKADAKEIIQDLISDLHASKIHPDPTVALGTAVNVAESFVNFHRTVNLIREYKPESLTPGGHPDNA